MLFILSRVEERTFDLIRVLAESVEKDVLLIGDAVFYATPFYVERLKAMGVENLFASREALEGVTLRRSPHVESLDYDGMASLIMEKSDKVVSL